MEHDECGKELSSLSSDCAIAIARLDGAVSLLNGMKSSAYLALSGSRYESEILSSIEKMQTYLMDAMGGLQKCNSSIGSIECKPKDEEEKDGDNEH